MPMSSGLSRNTGTLLRPKRIDSGRRKRKGIGVLHLMAATAAVLAVAAATVSAAATVAEAEVAESSETNIQLLENQELFSCFGGARGCFLIEFVVTLFWKNIEVV